MNDLHKAICRALEDADRPLLTTDEIVRQLREGWDDAEILQGLNQLTRDNVLDIGFLNTGSSYLVGFKLRDNR